MATWWPTMRRPSPSPPTPPARPTATRGPPPSRPPSTPATASRCRPRESVTIDVGATKWPLATLTPYATGGLGGCLDRGHRPRRRPHHGVGQLRRRHRPVRRGEDHPVHRHPGLDHHAPPPTPPARPTATSGPPASPPPSPRQRRALPAAWRPSPSGRGRDQLPGHPQRRRTGDRGGCSIAATALGSAPPRGRPATPATPT